MRNMFVAGLLAALAFATAAEAVGFTRILTIEAFRSLLVDRTLTDDLGRRMSVTTGGEITGRDGHAAVPGGWVWTDGTICRRIRHIGRKIEPDCRALWIRGNVVILQGTVPPERERSWIRS